MLGVYEYIHTDGYVSEWHTNGQERFASRTGGEWTRTDMKTEEKPTAISMFGVKQQIANKPINYRLANGSCIGLIYEPGNATRFDVFLYRNGSKLLVCLINFRTCHVFDLSMMSNCSGGYVSEKLKIPLGDAKEILKLIMAQL